MAKAGWLHTPGAEFAARPKGAWRPLIRAQNALQPRDVLIIQPSDIRYRARVLKIADSLTKSGRSVTFFTKMPAGSGLTDVYVDYVESGPILLFPDAHDFLRAARTKVPAWNWTFMVQYLQAAMWHYAQRISPRFIHTFNSAAIGIGRNYRDRFSRDGHHVAWFHDFPEYTPGHQFVDDRQSLSQPDQEWREVVVGHEAAHAPHSDASFTVSGEIAEMLARDYALPVPPQVLLNVPRLSDFDPKYEPTVRQTLRLLPEVPLFVYSGGVTALRGIETLISALGRFPSAHLAIVTNTKSAHLASLIDLARRQGIVSRLHLLPYVAPARISSFLRDATAGVHPLTHYGNGEVALPNKLFDYLHAGLPVVVSDVRAMRNIVSGRRLGVVFTAGDPAELAKALKAVTDDRNTIKDNIANNRPFLHECAWETQERRLLDVYEKWEKPSQI